MTRLKILLWVVALSQFALGGLTLFVPATFFTLMGLSAPAPDNNYMIGMLGARFVAYGVGMAYLSRQEHPSVFWVRNMVLIQGIDFAVGLYYVASGVIGLQVAAFPMFNAVVFAALLWVWQPSERNGVSTAQAA